MLTVAEKLAQRKAAKEQAERLKDQLKRQNKRAITPTKLLTDDEILQAAELYESGKGLTAIAHQFGVSPGQVRDRLIAVGTKLRPNYHRKSLKGRYAASTLEFIEELISRCDGTKTIVEISHEVDVSPSYIRSLERQFNLNLHLKETKVHDPLTAEEQSIIIEAYRDGEAIKDIAKSLEMSYDLVYRCLRRNGVPTRRSTMGRPTRSYTPETMKRIEVLKQVESGDITLEEASKLLNCHHLFLKSLARRTGVNLERKSSECSMSAESTMQKES